MAAAAADPTLFSQAAGAELDRSFPGPGISYLLLDSEGNVIAGRWPDAQRPVAPGSLVKPFLAVAYGEQHKGAFPQVTCGGTRSRCWLANGHGTLRLEEAITQSCNAYFLALAAGLDRMQAAQTFAGYGMAGPIAGSGGDALVGLGNQWKETPLALARAFLRLEKERQQPDQGRIVSGMRSAAARGTARGVDAALGQGAALAKTGTAECSHVPRGAADGLTMALYPASQPRLLLLVRVHGVTGAQSAVLAGRMLHSLGAGQAGAAN